MQKLRFMFCACSAVLQQGLWAFSFQESRAVVEIDARAYRHWRTCSFPGVHRGILGYNLYDSISCKLRTIAVIRAVIEYSIIRGFEFGRKTRVRVMKKMGLARGSRIMCSLLLLPLLLLLQLLWAVVEGAEFSERVENLPGQPGVRFQQYAGYVTVHSGNGRALFYWFVQADHKHASELPISFWFNGGAPAPPAPPSSLVNP